MMNESEEDKRKRIMKEMTWDYYLDNVQGRKYFQEMKEQGIKCVLTPEQAEKLEHSFLEMDTDNDGHVSREELQ